MNQGLSNFKRN